MELSTATKEGVLREPGVEVALVAPAWHSSTVGTQTFCWDSGDLATTWVLLTPLPNISKEVSRGVELLDPMVGGVGYIEVVAGPVDGDRGGM